MTDKEFRKLKKSELLELMLVMRKELERLGLENQQLKAQHDKTALLQEILRLAQESAEGVNKLCEKNSINLNSSEVEVK